MLNVGDKVIHRRSGKFGKIIGFGQAIINNTCQTTIKVLLMPKYKSETSGLNEDLYSEWLKLDNKLAIPV